MIGIKLFFVFFVLGVLFGAIWGILGFVKLILNNKWFFSHPLESAFAAFCVLGFFVTQINFNFGEFRFFLLVACILGFFIERKTLGKLFAKIYCWIYNKLKVGLKKLRQTKLIKKVLK